MFSFHMRIKIMMVSSFIVTLITGILDRLDTFMFALNMFSEITLVSSLIVTLVTSILDTFMFSLNMISYTSMM